MLLFKKIKRTSKVRPDMQIRISSRWNAFKERMANYLQQKSELVSVTTKKYGLLFFCLVFGGISIAIIFHSVMADEQFKIVTKISNPKNLIQEQKNFTQTDSSVTKQEFNKVENFKNYLFQLRADSSGRKKFDSILKERPGLMDSINLFEKMYLQQK